MNKKGFTLIELLIVVAIIGIIAAIAIPNLLVALQKGKQKATMGDQKNIGVGIESYLADNAMAPGAASIQALAVAPYFIPFYIKVVPTLDAWGTPYLYEAMAGIDSYTITSFGRGKVAGPAAPVPWYVTRLADFNPDLVYSNGVFISAPARR